MDMKITRIMAAAAQPDTQAAAEAVEQSLAQLKPNFILENIRKMTPGLDQNRIILN